MITKILAEATSGRSRAPSASLMKVIDVFGREVSAVACPTQRTGVVIWCTSIPWFIEIPFYKKSCNYHYMISNYYLKTGSLMFFQREL